MPPAPPVSSFDFNLELWSSAALPALRSGSYEIFDHCSSSSLTPWEFWIELRLRSKWVLGGSGSEVVTSASGFTSLGRVLAAKIWNYAPGCDSQITSGFGDREILGRCFINFTLRRHGFGDYVYNSLSFGSWHTAVAVLATSNPKAEIRFFGNLSDCNLFGFLQKSMIWLRRTSPQVDLFAARTACCCHFVLTPLYTIIVPGVLVHDMPKPTSKS